MTARQAREVLAQIEEAAVNLRGAVEACDETGMGPRVARVRREAMRALNAAQAAEHTCRQILLTEERYAVRPETTTSQGTR